MYLRADGRLENQRYTSMPFLSHPAELTDKYSEYLLEGPQPVVASSNPRNLFDDSNEEDRKWLKVALDNLSRLI